MIANVLLESSGGAPPVGLKLVVRHFLTARIETRSHTHYVVGRALTGSNSNNQNQRGRPARRRDNGEV